MVARSHSAQGAVDTRTMLLVLACTLAAVAAAPSYDQRQDGELNLQADLSNIVLIVGLPKKLPVSSLLAGLLMSSKSGDESNAQDRSDVHSLGAFVEPNTPYRVIIGAEGERIVEADGANAIVIPSRRRLEGEPRDEMKLIGAMEQCGPERTRDPVTLVCKSISELRAAQPERENTPEVVPAPT